MLATLVGLSMLVVYFLIPPRDYLPSGNQNLFLGFVSPPPGYSVDEPSDRASFLMLVSLRTLTWLLVFALSLVTNLAAGISPTPLNHEEVLEAGREAAPRLRRLLTGIAAAL